MKNTSYKSVPVNISGPSYESRSTAISIQKTMNLIPQSESAGASAITLVSWPGLSPFAAGSGVNRGMTVFNKELYKVTGAVLQKISSDGTVTEIGEILGNNRCVFSNDGTHLIIATTGFGYQLTNGVLTRITDADYQGGNSVAYLNLQMIFDGDGGKFQVADVGDPDSIQPNNFATAESAPDDTIRVYVFREQIYVMGERTIEVWYNSGSGNPPVSRVQNAVMQIGLGAVHSVVNTDEYMYFLGDDRRVYRVSAMQPQNVTSISVSHQLDKLGDLSGAVGGIVRIEGQNFYILKVQGKAFVFNEMNGLWFNLSTKADEQSYPCEDFVECYGKRLCACEGSVLELDLDAYTNNGDVIIKERVFGPITSKDLGLGDSRLIMSRLWLDMDIGTTQLQQGQGSNPQVAVSASFDGGKSFTKESDILVGRTGEGRESSKWDHCASFRTMFIKIRCSEPIFIAIYGANLEAKRSGI